MGRLEREKVSGRRGGESMLVKGVAMAEKSLLV